MSDQATLSQAQAQIRDRILCAIDTPDLDRARDLARGLAGQVGGIKLGLEFFSAHGPDGVRKVLDTAGDQGLFLDLKFHDIPNTVAAAIRAAVPLGPRMINVHGQGGRAMLEAARDAARESAAAEGVAPPLVLAVTVLTSLDGDDLTTLGIGNPVADQVFRLATLAAEAGLDGVVCSAREITLLRDELGPDFTLVTPGIRPANSDVGDQKRVMTPAEALAAGADYLVIGRPITGDADPAAAARRIIDGVISDTGN
jgi:orotidine-5'-phosphate decarboxylase